jgi:hypothetical protein
MTRVGARFSLIFTPPSSVPGPDLGSRDPPQLAANWLTSSIQETTTAMSDSLPRCPCAAGQATYPRSPQHAATRDASVAGVVAPPAHAHLGQIGPVHAAKTPCPPPPTAQSWWVPSPCPRSTPVKVYPHRATRALPDDILGSGSRGAGGVGGIQGVGGELLRCVVALTYVVDGED